jgi:2'-5' RNA ligase
MTTAGARLLDETQCLSQLDLPYLDPVRLDKLHLTLPRIGWADELTSESVGSVARTAEETCSGIHPFTLSIGPLAGSAGAVRFSVSPWDPLFTLRDALLRAIRCALGAECQEDGYRPHVGIAYCNSPVPATPLVKAIEPLRALRPLTST